MQFYNNSNKQITVRINELYIIPANKTVEIKIDTDSVLYISPSDPSYIHSNNKGQLVECVFSVTSKIKVEEINSDSEIVLECYNYTEVFSDESYNAVTPLSKSCKVTLLSMSVEDKDSVINDAINAKTAQNKNRQKWDNIFDVFEAIIHAFYGIPIYIVMYFCLRNYFSLKVTLLSILISYILIFMLCMVAGKTTDIFINKMKLTKKSNPESSINKYFDEQHIREFIFSDDGLKTKQ